MQTLTLKRQGKAEKAKMYSFRTKSVTVNNKKNGNTRDYRDRDRVPTAGGRRRLRGNRKAALARPPEPQGQLPLLPF